MSDHADSCPRWREPRDRALLLVRAEGEGMHLVLLLESCRDDGHYSRLHLDPCSTLIPQAGSRYEMEITGVADEKDMAQPVRVKPVRCVV